MTLFPEGLQVRSNRELARISPGLTPEQHSQLETVTDRYLRENKLIGFQNKKAIMPVIRQCVEDGLRINFQREKILPIDNLELAFKKGLDVRNRVIKIAELELDGLTHEAKLEGAIALPQVLAISGQKELDEKAFQSDIKACKLTAKISEIRRPIFNNLLQFSLGKVEEAIPGSRQMKLTVEQQAGLVRNLIFAWVAFKKPDVLLETQDFMAHKKTYTEALSQNNDEIWNELVKLTGLESNENTIGYLKDLSVQLEDMLIPVPNAPSPDADPVHIASAIDRGFKALDKHCLVINPFKHSGISEDPRSKDRSIWSKEMSIVVNVSGVNYRVPKPNTLRIASYLASAENKSRSSQFRNGADYVGNLIAEIQAQSNDITIPNLQESIEEQRKLLELKKDSIKKGVMPDEAVMDQDMVKEIAQLQKNLMDKELKMFDDIREYRLLLTDMGISLLQKYQDGNYTASEGDLEDLRILNRVPELLNRLAAYYIREHIKGRVRKTEDVIINDNFAEAMANRLEKANRLAVFPAAVKFTVLDILKARDNFWLKEFIAPNPRLSAEERQSAWQFIIELERNAVASQIWSEASEKRSLTDRVTEENRRKILENPSHPLMRRLSSIAVLEEEIARGDYRKGTMIFQKYVSNWSTSKDKTALNGISIWSDSESRFASLDVENLVKEKEEKENSPENSSRSTPDDDLILRSELGPERIILNALSKLAPDELWPTYAVDISKLAHNDFYKTESFDTKAQSRRQMQDKFYEWLFSRGIDVESRALIDLIGAYHLEALIKFSNNYHMLFGIENEVRRWFDTQKEKIDAQLQDKQAVYFRESPSVYLRKEQQKISTASERLTRLRQLAQRRLESAVNRLKGLNLILREEEFNE